MSNPGPAASLPQLRERHLPPEEAYLDDAVVTRRDAEGQPISSSSQPAIVAMWLAAGDRRSCGAAEEWWLRRPRISGS